jgi:rhodanese-related sulfurtransferase
MKKILLIAVWIFYLAAGMTGQTDSRFCLDTRFEQEVRSTLQFTIPVVSVADMQDLPKNYILLDAREKAEYEVSHIQNAIHIGYDNLDMQAIEDISRDTAVIVYCSVGYRSEKVGEKLLKMGFHKVSNLFGSIFEWANRDLPLHTPDGDITHRLHTFDERWSKWVTNPKIEKVW